MCTKERSIIVAGRHSVVIGLVWVRVKGEWGGVVVEEEVGCLDWPVGVGDVWLAYL